MLRGKKVVKRSRDKGFTLVELLVVITIIGIITILAFPSVRQLQARNNDKKFEKYAKSIESAGKLYTDSYSLDMFGNGENGCADIKFSDLQSKSLIKNYEEDEIVCDNENTFVHVVKKAGKYYYDISLNCTKGNKKVYSRVGPRCDGARGIITPIPKVVVSYTNVGGNDGWSTSKKIKITLKAPDGFIDNVSVNYGFSNSADVRPTDMKTHYFKNKYGDTEATYSFTDDSGKNGKYYLFVDGDEVIDIEGKFAADEWSSEMKFDNVGPSVPILISPKSDSWAGVDFVNAGSFVLNAKSLDPTPGSGISYYQYKYPNSENVWHKYDDSATNNFTTTPFTKERNELVEIRACDYSNNCSGSAQSMIRIDKTLPTCTVNLGGIMGENSWYKTNVAVSLSRNDTGGSAINSFDLTTSGSATYFGKSSATQTDTAGVTYYGYVKDNAGNTVVCSSNFKVDTVPPTCRLSVGSNITFASKNDATSQIASSGISTSTATNYSTSAIGISKTTFYGHVKDGAGHTSTCNATVIGTTSYNEVCGSYACGSHACGSHACGTKACGSRKCNCHQKCATRGQDTPYGQRCWQECSTCTNYCTTYCTSYCTSYCDSYCSGYRCSSGYTKLNDSYCYKLG